MNLSFWRSFSNEVSRFMHQWCRHKAFFHLFLPRSYFFTLLGLIKTQLLMIPFRLLLILHGFVLSMLYKACQEYLCFCAIFPLFWESEWFLPVWTLRPALVVAQDQEWQEFTCSHPAPPTLFPLLFPASSLSCCGSLAQGLIWSWSKCLCSFPVVAGPLNTRKK